MLLNDSLIWTYFSSLENPVMEQLCGYPQFLADQHWLGLTEFCNYIIGLFSIFSMIIFEENQAPRNYDECLYT